MPDKPEVVLVKLREIKYKIDRRASAKDSKKNTVSTKDIVRVIEGPCKVCTVVPVISCFDYFSHNVCLFCYLNLIFLSEANKHFFFLFTLGKARTCGTYTQRDMFYT